MRSPSVMAAAGSGAPERREGATAAANSDNLHAVLGDPRGPAFVARALAGDTHGFDSWHTELFRQQEHSQQDRS